MGISVVYSPHYAVDIGVHVFPTRKYRLVHDELKRRRHELPPFQFVEPAPADWDQLALVHTSEYLDKLRTGAMTPDDVAQLELPWSPQMVDGFRLMTGGTILAALIASGIESTTSAVTSQSVDSGPQRSDIRVVVHLGGGLHHAFPNHGEGFCPFNDVAVAVRVLQARGIRRHAIVDLDVHHGNGTAFIFGAPPPPTREHSGASADPEEDVPAGDVFTFSMHQQHNYPMWKPQGTLDIGLPDGVHDATYLRALERALPRVLAHRPECAFYLAGADPYEDDQLGGLRLSKEGLRQRDRIVIESIRDAGVPLVITLAGGYARRVEDTVAIHTTTIEEALASEPR